MSLAAAQVRPPHQTRAGTLPNGFKIIDARPIPEDWHLRPLLSVVRIANGQVDPREPPFRSMALVAPDHIESRTGRLLARVTAEEQQAISGKYLFAAGDIVYSKIRPYLRKAILADFGGLCSADMYPLTPLPGVSSRYVLAVLLGEHFSQYAESVSLRSGMPKINREELSGYSIAMPPTLLEQEAIGEALSSTDALIEALESLLSKKRAIKQGAMQELLSGQRRLPGFTGEWGKARLERLGDVLNGLTYSPKNVRDSGTLVLRSSNIQNDALSFDDNVFVQMDVPLESTVQANDILICVRNGSRDLIGKTVKLDERCSGAAFGAFMAVFRTRLHDFILHQLRSDSVKRQIFEHLGATINQITNKSLKSFIVAMPPTEEEAHAVSEILSNMDREIDALQLKLAKARQIKQGMMQELLTGRTRLV